MVCELTRRVTSSLWTRTSDEKEATALGRAPPPAPISDEPRPSRLSSPPCPSPPLLQTLLRLLLLILLATHTHTCLHFTCAGRSVQRGSPMP